MRLIAILTTTLSLFAAASAPAAEKGPTAADVRKAVERGLPFLEKHGVAWMNERGCLSCHTVAFQLWSFNEARRRGIPVDTRKIEEWTNWSLLNTVARGKEGGGLDTMSQLILSRDAANSWRDKPDRYMKTVDPFENVWEYIIDRQNGNGAWPVEGQLRVPQEITTMWALLALASRDTDPAPPADKATGKGLGGPLAAQMRKIDNALPISRDRALAFLKTVKPEDTTEALLLRVLVERKHGDAGRADEMRQNLLGRQNADGGWSYRPDDKASNAFATGQVLYALSIEGLTGDAPAIAMARKFLLDTQRPDGSWLVTTANVRPKSNGAKADPIYTFWGTAWAAIGLCRTLPEVKETKAGQ